MRQAHKTIAIEDKSSIGDARRTAVLTAGLLGFDEDRRSDIGIVATEAATNVLLHAGKGELILCPFLDGDAAWLDIFAMDSGPGIQDVTRAMEDGVSSIGTAGQGLGAMQRLSDDSSLYTVAGKGTVQWCRFRSCEPTPAMAIGLLNVPVHGETVCGDSYYVHLDPARSVYMLVDGLGHGVGAAEAAAEAVLTVSQVREKSALEIITHTHDALRKTRGAAMSVAIVDHKKMIVTYAGIGNVGTALLTGRTSRSVLPQNGTLGAVMPRMPQEYNFPVSPETLLLMYSDGLTTKSSTSGYPGLMTRHPAVMGSVLFRDFSRRRDDATVMVAPIGGSRA